MLSDRRLLGIPLAGGAPRLLATLGPGEAFVDWTTDTRHVFISDARDMSDARLWRLDVATGRRDLSRDIVVAAPAGGVTKPNLIFSRSGETYVYTFTRVLGDLYLVDGLQ